jgi:hypothetical protein
MPYQRTGLCGAHIQNKHGGRAASSRLLTCLSRLSPSAFKGSSRESKHLARVALSRSIAYSGEAPSPRYSQSLKIYSASARQNFEVAQWLRSFSRNEAYAGLAHIWDLPINFNFWSCGSGFAKWPCGQ